MLNVTPGFRAASTAPRMRAITSTRGGGVILRAREASGLSLDEIAHRAPAVFAEDKHESRSARYEFIDTREVLGGLIREGFKVMEVRQGGSRIAGKAAFTKHALRLSAPDSFTVEARPGDKSTAQVVLINAHDGTSAYRLRAGLYRFLCLNGLVMGEDFEDVRVGHTKSAPDKIIDAAFRVVSDFPRAIEQVREFAALELSGGEQMALATAARQLRWEPQEEAGEVRQPPVDVVALLQPRRHEDVGNSLWLAANRVQENLIRGGQSYRTRTQKGKVQNRTVGAVNSIDEDSKINRALMTLAAEMAKLKAAA